MKKLRNLICTVVGHVDTGKTTILDHLRGTSIASQEAGLITQNISCCELQFKGMQKICQINPEFKNIKLPGLLFIDTPGHIAFNNLRKRGGSLADIAILVIDVNEGIKDQTIESIEILKKNKTPFIIAANKVDLIPGYQDKSQSILENIEAQSETTKIKIHTKIYEIVGRLAEYDLNADIFNRIEDFTKTIAIVPLSAKKEQGLADLLLVLCGLAQKFLEKNLNVNTEKDGKATILEVKEEKGVGLVLDTVVYDGNIKKGDTILIAGLQSPIKTKIKGLFTIENKKLKPIEKTEAASYVKIIALGTEDVIAGMPLIVANEKDTSEKEKDIQKEIEEVLIETDKKGVIVKADSLGSLEALIGLLKENKILIKKATIGDITKKDIADASAEENKLYRVILGFNVKLKEKTKEVKIINKDIIYKIVDEYKEFETNEKKTAEAEATESLPRPFKIMILQGCVFRQKNPAVVGVEIIEGIVKIGSKIMNENGKSLGEIRTIQLNGKDIKKAKRPEQVAIALPDVTVGRHIFENETLLSDFTEGEFRKIKELREFLSEPEKILLKQIAEIKRQNNKLWGV
ncbi:MAG: translation initiation factor IF-2 [Nanoarchaeota archaeon]|nr:translation initiation factor IF-2 [Nanoarchaeota archaeon]